MHTDIRYTHTYRVSMRDSRCSHLLRDADEVLVGVQEFNQLCPHVLGRGHTHWVRWARLGSRRRLCRHVTHTQLKHQ